MIVQRLLLATQGLEHAGLDDVLQLQTCPVVFSTALCECTHAAATVGLLVGSVGEGIDASLAVFAMRTEIGGGLGEGRSEALYSIGVE